MIRNELTSESATVFDECLRGFRGRMRHGNQARFGHSHANDRDRWFHDHVCMQIKENRMRLIKHLLRKLQ